MKRINRVLKYREFSEIINNNTPVIKSKHFVIHFRKNQFGFSRIGIGVSKRNGHAVKRNKIRRQIRAMIASDYDLSKSFDLIIIVRTNYETELFSEEKSELIASLAKIGVQP